MASCVILGATGTIGSTLAKQLVELDRSVLLVGRDRHKLAALATDLQQPFAAIDFTESRSLEVALQERSEQCGGYDGLVNCIGSLLLKPAHSTSDEEFRQVVETNLFTAFSTIRAGGKMLREHGGAIVLIASAAAQIGIGNHEAIAAAKGGIIALARSAAATYAPYNIRVNVVSPGLVRTEMTRRIWENPAAATASTDLHALGRLGEPTEIVSLITWLLDGKNSWMTGQVLAIDGGLSLVQSRRRPPP